MLRDFGVDVDTRHQVHLEGSKKQATDAGDHNQRDSSALRKHFGWLFLDLRKCTIAPCTYIHDAQDARNAQTQQGRFGFINTNTNKRGSQIHFTWLRLTKRVSAESNDPTWVGSNIDTAIINKSQP